MSVSKDLVSHTASISHLNLEQYPGLLQSYDGPGDLQPGTFVQLYAELMGTHQRANKAAQDGCGDWCRSLPRFLPPTLLSERFLHVPVGYTMIVTLSEAFSLDFWSWKPKIRIFPQRTKRGRGALISVSGEKGKAMLDFGIRE